MREIPVKKNDMILISVIAVLALALFAFTNMTVQTGAYAVISVDGSEIKRLPLFEDTSYTIEGVGGHNDLVIEDGEAYLTDADCPDRLCVKMGKISKNGESIICLPHKVVVEISGGKDNDVDLMVK